MLELENISLEGLVHSVRTGAVQATRLAEHYVNRWKTTTSLNAITWIAPEEVMRAASKIDQDQQEGRQLGKLAGIPFVVKDNIYTRQFPTTAGSRTFRGFMPNRNAKMVTEIENCGGLFLGKTNMHELAMGGTTNNAAFGATNNPYAFMHIPGGSSGGAAAAVAARIVPIALGSDTGGSIRIPASFCGVAGLRPSVESWSRKTYSDDGLIPSAGDFDTVGPIARSVEDLAYFDRVLRHVERPDIRVPGKLRIGLPTNYYFDDLQPEVRRVVNRALDSLKEAGHELVEIDLEKVVEHAEPAFFALLNAGICRDFGDFLISDSTGITMDRVISEIQAADARHMAEGAIAAATSDEEVKNARDIRSAARQCYVSALTESGLDAIAFPTSPILPPLQKEEPNLMRQFRNTMVGAFLGMPGLSLPVGLSLDGLPVGMELDGYPDGETRLLSVGVAIEATIGRLAPPNL